MNRPLEYGGFSDSKLWLRGRRRFVREATAATRGRKGMGERGSSETLLSSIKWMRQAGRGREMKLSDDIRDIGDTLYIELSACRRYFALFSASFRTAAPSLLLSSVDLPSLRRGSIFYRSFCSPWLMKGTTVRVHRRPSSVWRNRPTLVKEMKPRPLTWRSWAGSVQRSSPRLGGK